LLKKGSCAKLYVILTKGRRYVSYRSSLLHFNSPDLNSKHLRFSAQVFFSLVSLCSCIRIGKKIDPHFLKSWESLCCKESNHFLSRTCISVFGSLKISRELIWDQFKVWTLVEKKIDIEILDKCKCSEDFLAPTTTTPILLSATFSVHIDHWLARRELLRMD
jgi:hypothetical protein